MKQLVRVLEEMIGYKCKILVGETWKYNTNGIITINPYDTYMNVLDWKMFLAKEFNFKLTRDNWIIMSALHELGHHMTISRFSMKEIRDSQRLHENTAEHFYEPVEMVATIWAINYYNSHDMNEWIEEVKEAMN